MNVQISALKTGNWQGSNFLIAITFFVLLVFSLFVGDWGFTNMYPYQLRFFLQAFLVYFFARLLPLSWSFVALLAFASAFAFYKTDSFMQPTFGYFLALGFALLILNKLSWKYWLFAPFVLHGLGALYFICVDTLQNHQFISYEYLLESLSAVPALSRDSFLLEIVLIYPLMFVSIQFTKLIDWFRNLE